MRFKLSLSTLWSAVSNHNNNAALHIYGPPAMWLEDLRLPAVPASVQAAPSGLPAVIAEESGRSMLQGWWSPTA